VVAVAAAMIAVAVGLVEGKEGGREGKGREGGTEDKGREGGREGDLISFATTLCMLISTLQSLADRETR
jgi:hypothetical protein